MDACTAEIVPYRCPCKDASSLDDEQRNAITVTLYSQCLWCGVKSHPARPTAIAPAEQLPSPPHDDLGTRDARGHVVVLTIADSCIMHFSLIHRLGHGTLSAAMPLMTDAAKVSDTPLARMSDDEVALRGDLRFPRVPSGAHRQEMALEVVAERLGKPGDLSYQGTSRRSFRVLDGPRKGQVGADETRGAWAHRDRHRDLRRPHGG
jgi:hypothetical protein